MKQLKQAGNFKLLQSSYAQESIRTVDVAHGEAQLDVAYFSRSKSERMHIAAIPNAFKGACIHGNDSFREYKGKAVQEPGMKL